MREGKNWTAEQCAQVPWLIFLPMRIAAGPRAFPQGIKPMKTLLLFYTILCMQHFLCGSLEKGCHNNWKAIPWLVNIPLNPCNRYKFQILALEKSFFSVYKVYLILSVLGRFQCGTLMRSPNQRCGPIIIFNSPLLYRKWYFYVSKYTSTHKI